MRIARQVARWIGAAAVLGALSASAAAAADETRPGGPWSGTVKVGPAIEASARAPTQLALELDLAYAVVGDRGYLGLAPQLQVIDDAEVVVPVAFQYDVRLPVEGLSVYPRIAAGVSMVPAADAVGFAIQPEIGVKWQLDERVHAVFEPVSFPMTFGDPVLIHARIFAGVGADL